MDVLYERWLDHLLTVADTSPIDVLQPAADALRQQPDHPRAIFLMGYLMLKTEQPSVAYQLYRRVAEIAPDKAPAWNNLAKACQEMCRYDQAREYLWRVLALDPGDAAGLQNMGVVALNRAEPEEAIKLCRLAEQLDRDLFVQARDTISLANLALGHWGEGWDDFDTSLGGKYRKRKIYGPRVRDWGGPAPEEYPDAGASVVINANGAVEKIQPWLIVYGEQGIGDEIFFGSMIPDLNDGKRNVVIDCDERLAGLFRRSFPWAKVAGTRRNESPPWFDAAGEYVRVAMGSLGKWFRRTESSWPGTPFLKPDPMRTFQWQALFRAGKHKPVIGIGWTGGKPATGSADKSMSLDDLRPLFAAFPDAQFVSLEYKPVAAEVAQWANDNKISLVHFPWATETQDYDNTAALTAACDVVVSVMTSGAHLAAAMGKPTIMMLPTRPQPEWRYHGRAERVPYYKAMRLVRQTKTGEWSDVVANVAAQVGAIVNGGLREAA